ncbi:MAG: hypothetical protein ACR2I1_04270 [Propionibacteriaceae bacterium]
MAQRLVRGVQASFIVTLVASLFGVSPMSRGRFALLKRERSDWM